MHQHTTNAMFTVAHPAAVLQSSAVFATIAQQHLRSAKQKPQRSAAKDARRSVSGSHSGWLAKAKSNDARAKWFSSSTRRFFTINYDSQIFFYSRSESDQKISQPIGFRDILSAHPLPESGINAFGFVLQTRNRDYELFAESEWDAALWVAGLNRARDGVDTAASDSTSAGESSASGASTPLSSQGSPRSSHSHSDHGPRGPKGGYPVLLIGHESFAAAARQRAPSPVREDPFEALEALEAMVGLRTQEVQEREILLKPSRSGHNHEDRDANKLSLPNCTAHVAALAMTQHNIEADAWDSDDTDDDKVAHEDASCAKGSQLSSVVDFTRSHNAHADVWDSDDEDEEDEAMPIWPALVLDALPESVEPKVSKTKRRSNMHSSADETQGNRKARKEARREARRMEGETDAKRGARREALRDRQSKRSAAEVIVVEATPVKASPVVVFKDSEDIEIP